MVTVIKLTNPTSFSHLFSLSNPAPPPVPTDSEGLLTDTTVHVIRRIPLSYRSLSQRQRL